jgi:hypothetical protein
MAKASGVPNITSIRPGWARSSVMPMTCVEPATSPVHQVLAIRGKSLQEGCRSDRIEKGLVHITPHPVHTSLLVGPGQGMAALTEMLSGVLVL